MLKADIGMNALHFGALSLGVALNIIHYFRRALFRERLGHTFNIAAAIVWACCWIFFPNALVRVLFLQGPYIKRKTFSLFGLLTQQPHTVPVDLPVDLDCFTTVLLVLTLWQFGRWLVYTFSPVDSTPPRNFSPTTPSMLPLSSRDTASLKTFLRRVGLKKKFPAQPSQQVQVATLVDELISLSPDHIRTWLVNFTTPLDQLPTTFA